MRRLFLLFLLGGLILGLVACGGGDEADSPQEVTLSAFDTFTYEPETIEVVAGRPVALTLVNDGVLDHDLSIVDIPLSGEVEMHGEEAEHDEDEHEMTMDEDELAVHVSATAGGSQTITFTPAEAGEYEFFCTVPGHQDGGMIGTLVVSAP